MKDPGRTHQPGGALGLALRGRQTAELREHVTDMKGGAELASDVQVLAVQRAGFQKIAPAVSGDAHELADHADHFAVSQGPSDGHAPLIELVSGCKVTGDVGRQAEQVERPGEQPTVTQALGEGQALLSECPSAGVVTLEIGDAAQHMQHPRHRPRVAQLSRDRQALFEQRARRSGVVEEMGQPTGRMESLRPGR